MAEQYNVPTDENLNPAPSRVKLSSMSLPSLKITNGEIFEEAKRELRYPQCIPIYQQMVLEPTIASALSLLEILISRSKWEVKAPEGSSEVEKERAKFINWSIRNMDRPWEEYIIEFLSYMVWGFQPAEKIFSSVRSGKHKGKMAPIDFRCISPTTISKWIYEIKSGNLAGVRQDLSKINSDFNRLDVSGDTKRDIPRSKFMLFRYNTKSDNPQGNSPLKSCYISWKQKVTVEDYEIIGAARGLGGVPIIGVDVEFLAKASDPNSDEAKILTELDRQAALLHAGEQAFVRKPLAYTERGDPLFTFEVEGLGASQFDSEEIIKRLENKMLMAFLADVLKLGTESHGSYALADSKTSLLAMGVEHHLKIIQRTLNHDLIRHIYVLNGWEYDTDTSAKFFYNDIEKQDLDVLSKFIQRTITSGALRPTKDLEDFLTEQIGLDPKAEDNMELIETEITSASGQGNGTSGFGTNAQDNTQDNMDNAP